MAFDLIEDLLAFLYSKGDGNTSPGKGIICPVCASVMEENEDGELRCPECDD